MRPDLKILVPDSVQLSSNPRSFFGKDNIFMPGLAIKAVVGQPGSLKGPFFYDAPIKICCIHGIAIRAPGSSTWRIKGSA
jgi:hypothetical protein